MPHYLSDEEILAFAEEMLETYSQQEGFEDVAALVADFPPMCQVYIDGVETEGYMCMYVAGYRSGPNPALHVQIVMQLDDHGGDERYISPFAWFEPKVARLKGYGPLSKDAVAKVTKGKMN